MPSYKLRNFKPVKTINGVSPDITGNITILEGGGGFRFKEEIFIVSDLVPIILSSTPSSGIPLTVTVNGLVQSRNDYILAGNTISFPEGSVETNDIVRIMYAYGG